MQEIRFTEYAPDEIRGGLPFEELEQLVNLLGLSQRDAAHLLLVSERTLSRRRREGRLSQAESDRLVRIAGLVENALEAFDHDVEAAIDWLTSKKALLSGESPLLYADTEPGLQAVRDMLGVIQHTMAA